jgi:hypothetical protein
VVQQRHQINFMTSEEIKLWVDSLTDEERFLASAYLQHRAQENDPVYQAELLRRMAQMEQGRKISFEAIQRIHQILE